jgi:hypothetical protein
MSRRGRSGPTISLFSFQDIITSVTAIVTVVTLLLALDLVNRQPAEAGGSSATLGMELVRRLEQAESELAQLQAQTASTDELVRQVAATSPADLRSDIALRQSRISELEREKHRLDEQKQKLQAKLKERLAEQFDIEPLKAELAEIEQTIIELERQRAEEVADDRPIFSLPRGFDKEGWIVEIDREQVQVAPIGRAAAPMKFVATGLPVVGSSAADNFEKWIDRQGLLSAYFLLLIRPEASAEFDRVQQMLEKKKISHGFDLVDDDQTVLDPERGAAP